MQTGSRSGPKQDPVGGGWFRRGGRSSWDGPVGAPKVLTTSHRGWKKHSKNSPLQGTVHTVCPIPWQNEIEKHLSIYLSIYLSMLGLLTLFQGNTDLRKEHTGFPDSRFILREELPLSLPSLAVPSFPLKQLAAWIWFERDGCPEQTDKRQVEGREGGRE